jgi:hypothetical protein
MSFLGMYLVTPENLCNAFLHHTQNILKILRNKMLFFVNSSLTLVTMLESCFHNMIIDATTFLWILHVKEFQDVVMYIVSR